MIVNLSIADLVKGQPITPGWYKASIIKSISKNPKNSNESMNHIPTFKIETEIGEEVDHVFNSKAMVGFGQFVAAIQNKTFIQVLEEAKKNGGRLIFDFDTSVGSKLQIKIINEPYEGRLINKVDAPNGGFLPYDANVPF